MKDIDYQKILPFFYRKTTNQTAVRINYICDAFQLSNTVEKSIYNKKEMII
jgi:hypothetical protein